MELSLCITYSNNFFCLSFLLEFVFMMFIFHAGGFEDFWMVCKSLLILIDWVGFIYQFCMEGLLVYVYIYIYIHYIYIYIILKYKLLLLYICKAKEEAMQCTRSSQKENGNQRLQRRLSKLLSTVLFRSGKFCSQQYVPKLESSESEFVIYLTFFFPLFAILLRWTNMEEKEVRNVTIQARNKDQTQKIKKFIGFCWIWLDFQVIESFFLHWFHKMMLICWLRYMGVSFLPYDEYGSLHNGRLNIDTMICFSVLLWWVVCWLDEWFAGMQDIHVFHEFFFFFFPTHGFLRFDRFCFLFLADVCIFCSEYYTIFDEGDLNLQVRKRTEIS